MQRGEPGEHREDHAQLGMLAAPGAEKGEPSCLHARRHSGERRPPQRIAERGPRRRGQAAAARGPGPGWTNSGAPWASRRASTERRREQPSTPPSAPAGSDSPTQPRSSARSTSSGSGRSSAIAPHTPNGPPSDERALVVGVDQGLRLLARQTPRCPAGSTGTAERGRARRARRAPRGARAPRWPGRSRRGARRRG